MDDYVAKPIRQAEVATALQRFLGSGTPSVPGAEADASLSDAARGAIAPAIEKVLPSLRLDRLDPLVRERLEELARLGGPELAATAIGGFFHEAIQYQSAIALAIDEEDAPALRIAAHTLKGGALMLGLREVAATSLELESLGRAGTTAGALKLLPALDAALARARGMLQAADLEALAR
jgi:HPt (histidine-containing phosphotransfer) domain-containing protein